jgi:hypothetical protein
MSFDRSDDVRRTGLYFSNNLARKAPYNVITLYVKSLLIFRPTCCNWPALKANSALTAYMMDWITVMSLLSERSTFVLILPADLKIKTFRDR